LDGESELAVLFRPVAGEADRDLPPEPVGVRSVERETDRRSRRDAARARSRPIVRAARPRGGADRIGARVRLAFEHGEVDAANGPQRQVDRSSDLIRAIVEGQREVTGSAVFPRRRLDAAPNEVRLFVQLVRPAHPVICVDEAHRYRHTEPRIARSGPLPRRARRWGILLDEQRSVVLIADKAAIPEDSEQGNQILY